VGTPPDVPSPPAWGTITDVTSLTDSGRKRPSLARRRRSRAPLTQAQKAWIVVLNIVGAIVATCAGLIVLAIIVGLADGH
jgi:hypothetical protein